MELSSVTTNLGDHTRDAIIITEAEPIDLPGPKNVWVNKAFTELTGYTPEEVVGQTPRILQGEDTSEEARTKIRQALMSWTPIRITLKNYTKDGSAFWVDLDIKPVADETGWYRYWVPVQRDVTSRISEQTQLQKTLEQISVLKERLRLATEAADIGVWEWDLTNNTIHWDPVLQKLYGLTDRPNINPDEIWKDLIHPEDKDRVEENLQKSINSGTDYDEEFRIITPQFEEKVLRSRASIDLNSNSNAIRVIGVNYEITEHKKREEELLHSRSEILKTQKQAEHDATHDALTGLGNRRGARRYWTSLERDSRTSIPVAILLIDLDRFKAINDRFGHIGGDFLLCSIADKLRNIVNDDGYIARMGGDEFLIILTGSDVEMRASEIGSKILQACRKPVLYNDQKMHFGASIGIRIGASHTIKDFLDDADIALYAAKNDGRNRMQVFTPEIRKNATADKHLADNFVEALEQKQISVSFQPQICSKSGRLFGIEALARWKDPELRELSPEHFFPVATELGLVNELDALVFHKALQSAHTLAGQGINIPRLSVNVSEQRLTDPNLLSTLDALPALPCPISFELVESIDLTNPKASLLQRIEALRHRGIQIDIDDFGSSHAALTTLLHLRPDCIKIDKQFVLHGHSRGTTPSILLQTICEMCQRLQIPVIAEGAENADIASMLKQLGCDVLQGNHYSTPLTEEDFATWYFKYLNDNGGAQKAAC